MMAKGQASETTQKAEATQVVDVDNTGQQTDVDGIS